MNPPETTRPLDLVKPLKKPHRHHSRSKLSRTIKRIRRTVNWRILFLIVISIVVVLIVGGLVLTTDAVNRVSTSVSNLNRVVAGLGDKPATELTLTDFQRVSSSVDDLLYNLTTARQQISFLRPFGSFNGELTTTFQALDIAENLAQAARSVLDGLEPTLFFLVSGDSNGTVVTQISSGERIIELLQIGRPQFINANSRLAAAHAELDQVDFAKTSPSLLLNLQTLSRYQEQFQNINNLLSAAPETLQSLLGLNGAQSYLILAQNNDELRPSGGYLSTYGWMTVRNGRIIDYDYSPTTATSPNPPDVASPYSIPAWWIQYDKPLYAAWDGSWYADFPSTAEMALWYYNTGNNPQSPINGVIAIDIQGFQDILAVLKQVYVPDYNLIVTPDNFRQVVYDIRAYGGGDIPHKHFLAAVYRQIFSDWQSVDRDQAKSTALLGAVLQALQEKHLIVYFSDQQLNQAVNVLGWSGTQLPATSNDYLMVADANLGNKSNHSITRQLTYDVDIQAGGTLNVHTTVAYDYPRRVAETDPAVNPEFHGPLDYENLLQVFVPAGSTLTSTNNLLSDPQTVTENSHNVFITQVEIPYDSGDRFQFTYTTPPLVETLGPYQRYRLLLQKQPGTPGDLTNVQVSLPAKATIINTAPEAAASYNLDRPILEFQVQLTTDQWIEVIYKN